jgi:C4-dicarboxylate-specific signal transduction histidine kinase
MDYADVSGWASGLLQSGVALYALLLTRRYGTARVGWSVVSALGLLALLHVLSDLHSFPGKCGVGIAEDFICALVSILLMAGMAHLESMLVQRVQAEKRERQSQQELESRVQEQTAELTQANEELSQTALRLQAEVADRKQMQDQMERTHKELLVVSRQAGMSEVATGVLHNVGNVLNSLNVSATLVGDHVADLKLGNLTRAANLMRDQGENLGHFITHDSRGRQLPGYLAELAKHLADEQHLILKEIGFVKSRIDHIKEIVATQQNYGRVSGLTERVKIAELVDDVLRMQATELADRAVELRRDYAPALPEIIVDKHKVLQILLNLVTNAKHACLESAQPEKRLTVRVTNGDGRVRVMMSDNGVGIPEANLTKIFNHGFTTKKKGGHGFGLHSGALAAKEMGGALTARSDGPGTGATFTLELPLQPNRPKG